MIELEAVSKVFPGGVEAVKDVSLVVEESETFVLIGLSGCGKTTTLKMVNRLIEPTSGAIRIAGRDIMQQSPVDLRRGIGYVIQDIGLFPHMTVGANIGIVMRLFGLGKREQRSRAAELLELVGLDPAEYLDRYPAELSGGQQQRVGVARALCADPPVLLMDEPFGALDPITREQLQSEFRTLEEHIRKTIVLVTHDIFEAVLLGDRIGIMAEGRLVQVDSPETLLQRPANEFVAKFLGQHRFQLQMSTVEAGEVAVTGTELKVRLLSGDTHVGEALSHAERHCLSAVIVKDGDAGIAGLVEVGELRSAAPDATRLGDVAANGGPVLSGDATLLEAIRALADSRLNFVPVVDDSERLLGIATRASVATALNEALGLAAQGADRP
jgi:osmoprotectant transport system ATP-binding protein